MELALEGKAREQGEEEGEENLVQIHLFKNLLWVEQFSPLPPCLSGIGWIKNSLKEKQRINLDKINRMRRSHE
jgi:hypothetical protein